MPVHHLPSTCRQLPRLRFWLRLGDLPGWVFAINSVVGCSLQSEKSTSERVARIHGTEPETLCKDGRRTRMQEQDAPSHTGVHFGGEGLKKSTHVQTSGWSAELNMNRIPRVNSLSLSLSLCGPLPFLPYFFLRDQPYYSSATFYLILSISLSHTPQTRARVSVSHVHSTEKLLDAGTQAETHVQLYADSHPRPPSSRGFIHACLRWLRLRLRLRLLARPRSSFGRKPRRWKVSG